MDSYIIKLTSALLQYAVFEYSTIINYNKYNYISEITSLKKKISAAPG